MGWHACHDDGTTKLVALVPQLRMRHARGSCGYETVVTTGEGAAVQLAVPPDAAQRMRRLHPASLRRAGEPGRSALVAINVIQRTELK